MNGAKKIDSGVQYTKSAMVNMVNPIPTAGPLTIATNGFSSSNNAVRISTKSTLAALCAAYTALVGSSPI